MLIEFSGIRRVPPTRQLAVTFRRDDPEPCLDTWIPTHHIAEELQSPRDERAPQHDLIEIMCKVGLSLSMKSYRGAAEADAKSAAIVVDGRSLACTEAPSAEDPASFAAPHFAA